MPAVPPARLRAPQVWLRPYCWVGQTIAVWGLPRRRRKKIACATS